MIIQSLFNVPHRLTSCIDFVSAHFGNREYFAEMLTDCTRSSDRLPQGYMLFKDDNIIGFVGLIRQECIVCENLSPWISPLLVAPEERGNQLGSVLLEHVRKEAGRLGYFKLYLTTDHIGYYEKYGFREIGLSLFTWGRPTKIYTVNSIGVEKLTGVLREKYPDAKAILLGGSFARNDGVDVQDIDIKVILDSDCDENTNETFTLNTLIDVGFAKASNVFDMENLLGNAYNAGFYNDAEILYDRDGDLAAYLNEYKQKYTELLYHKRRVSELRNNLEKQYRDVLSAYESGDEIALHCRFATYIWTLCDAALVKNLYSPSWIRGLHKLSKADKQIANKVISAEGHRFLQKKALLNLMPLYSEFWKGEFWDFLKTEIEWLISNDFEPHGFHSLQICFMMGVENHPQKKELFARWQEIAGRNNILPARSIEGFSAFHKEMLEYLSAL